MIIQACRSCGNSKLEPVLSLGKTPLANALLTEGQLRNLEPYYPLDLVFEGIYLDKRWQWCLYKDPSILAYLKPGAGFGGSCLPKDNLAFLRFPETKGYQAQLIKSVLDINSERINHIMAILECRQSRGCKQVSILGLAFNPETSDIRHSPAVILANKLLDTGMEVRAYDPCVKKLETPGRNLQLCQTVEQAIKDSEAAIIMTAWDEFISFPPNRWKELMAVPFLLDCRRALRSSLLKEAGVEYIGLGDYYRRGTL